MELPTVGCMRGSRMTDELYTGLPFTQFQEYSDCFCSVHASPRLCNLETTSKFVGFPGTREYTSRTQAHTYTRMSSTFFPPHSNCLFSISLVAALQPRSDPRNEQCKNRVSKILQTRSIRAGRSRTPIQGFLPPSYRGTVIVSVLYK